MHSGCWLSSSQLCRRSGVARRASSVGLWPAVRRHDPMSPGKRPHVDEPASDNSRQRKPSSDRERHSGQNRSQPWDGLGPLPHRRVLNLVHRPCALYRIRAPKTDRLFETDPTVERSRRRALPISSRRPVATAGCEARDPPDRDVEADRTRSLRCVTALDRTAGTTRVRLVH